MFSVGIPDVSRSVKAGPLWDRQSPGGVGADRLSPSEGGGLLPGRLRLYLQLRSPAKGRLRHDRRNGSRTWPHGGTVCPGPGRGCTGDAAGPLRVRSGSQSKRGELGPPSSNAPAPEFKGDWASLSGLLHQGVRRVRVAQVGQRALGAC